MGISGVYSDKIWKELVEVSEELYGVGEDIIVGESKVKMYVEIRRMMMHLYRIYTKDSLHQMGWRFKKNHSTVVYHLDKAEDFLKYDKFFQAEYARFKEKLMEKMK